MFANSVEYSIYIPIILYCISIYISVIRRALLFILTLIADALLGIAELVLTMTHFIARCHGGNCVLYKFGSECISLLLFT